MRIIIVGLSSKGCGDNKFSGGGEKEWWKWVKVRCVCLCVCVQNNAPGVYLLLSFCRASSDAEPKLKGETNVYDEKVLLREEISGFEAELRKRRFTKISNEDSFLQHIVDAQTADDFVSDHSWFYPWSVLVV